MTEQPKFIQRAKETYSFHREKCLSHDNWTLGMTSRALRRSSGSVSEDLLIARWCKTHEKQIEKFTYSYEALEFIRNKQREVDLGELE